MCHCVSETIFHLLSAFPVLAATEYLKRHNSVASLVHRSLCSHFGASICDKPWLCVPESVVQMNEAKTLWDFDIYTDRYIPVNSPDIVIINKNSQLAVLVDVAVPADLNIASKEKERLINIMIYTLSLKIVEVEVHQSSSNCDWMSWILHSKFI